MKPRRLRSSHGEMRTRFIPETVLDQLRSHLTAFPDDLRRMVVLLQESGIRVRELCCLSYDCLELHTDGHRFLHYLDQKTERGRRIPLSPLAVEAIIEQQQALERSEKRDSHYLFPNQKGQPSSPQSFIRELNRLAAEKHICDATGTVWRFRRHQIRTTVLWRLLHIPPDHVTRLLRHVAIEGQPPDLLQDGADGVAIEEHRDLLPPGSCTLENSCPWHDPITHYYVQQSDSLLMDGWDDWIEDIQQWPSEVDESPKEVDELQEIEEYDSDEPVLFVLGHMLCVVYEQRETAPGSLLCKECVDEQKTLDSESNPEPRGVPLFELGRIIATRGAIETMERRGIDYNALLVRHVTGDWGDLAEEDHENEHAVKHGRLIHSAYGTQDDPDRLWIITESDRHATTILLPDEY
jgi:hypothetical protein